MRFGTPKLLVKENFFFILGFTMEDIKKSNIIKIPQNFIYLRKKIISYIIERKE